MSTFELRDPNFAARVRDSFARQTIMQTFGAELTAVRPGAVDIALPFRDDLTQQHGYLHAAAITAIADSACGYAALTLTEAGREVLSVEFKTNLLAPATGDRFVAEGRVLRPGRRLTVCTADVVAHQADDRESIARMQATMTTVDANDGSSSNGE